MKDHAQFCAEELYTAVKDQKYEMALSFLRGFRDVFASSADAEIRNLFVCKFNILFFILFWPKNVATGELATLKNIVLMRYRHIMKGGSIREMQPPSDSQGLPHSQGPPPPSAPWSTNREPTWSDQTRHVSSQLISYNLILAPFL